MKTLIIGPSGSGKSTLAQKLSEEGFNAYSGDSYAEHFYKKSLMAVGESYVPTFLDRLFRIGWQWTNDGLNLIKSTDKIVWLGSSDNMMDIIHEFDQIIYLKCTKRNLFLRLKQRKGDNTYGKKLSERFLILSRRDKWHKRIKNKTYIDANKPFSYVYSEVKKLIT